MQSKGKYRMTQRCFMIIAGFCHFLSKFFLNKIFSVICVYNMSVFLCVFFIYIVCMVRIHQSFMLIPSSINSYHYYVFLIKYKMLNCMSGTNKTFFLCLDCFTVRVFVSSKRIERQKRKEKNLQNLFSLFHLLWMCVFSPVLPDREPPM